MMSKDIKITRGSDNVYKDLGYKNPEEMRKKADIAFAIYQNIIKLVNISPHTLYQITNGNFTKHSVKKLNKILQILKKVNKR